MTRVPPKEQPLTLEEYMTLDSAGKKKNLFIRLLSKADSLQTKLRATEETLREAQKGILEGNQKLEASNVKAFVGNEEISDLKRELRESKCDSERCRAELQSIKSKWWFKVFNIFST